MTMTDERDQETEVVPRIEAGRIALRPFTPDDAETVEVLIDDAEVAAGTLTIPHPYPKGAARPWIEAQVESYRAGKSITWAVVTAPADQLLGAISVRLTPAHHRAEIGYWIARASWGNGYATDAVRAVLAFGFEKLELHRIDAHHFVENPASGRVMLKAGMRSEGRRRGAVWRDGVPRDLEEYAILRSDPRG